MKQKKSRKSAPSEQPRKTKQVRETGAVIVPAVPAGIQQPTMKVVRSNPVDPHGRLEDVLALTDGHELSPILQTAKDIVNACKARGTTPPDWCVIVLVGTFDVVTACEWNALRDNVT